jgi:hypothetical protein
MFRVIYNLVSKQITTCLFAGDGYTAYDQSLFGHIPGDLNTVLNQLAVLKIDPAPFIQFLTDNEIDASGISDNLTAYREQNHATTVARDLFVALKAQELSDTQTAFIITKILAVLMALTWGRLHAAKLLAEALTVEAPFTAARKTYLVNRIDAEIALL